MKIEIQYGSSVYADGTIKKETIYQFENKIDMINYYNEHGLKGVMRLKTFRIEVSLWVKFADEDFGEEE